MVTTSRCSVISLTVRVLGTATSIPDCNTGTLIMKITSSTSTTSTIGVMLISAIDVRVWPLLLVKATVHLPACISSRFTNSFSVRRPRRSRRAHRNLFQRIKQLAAKVVDGRGKHPDARRELVISNDRRNGHKQSRRGGNQRLADAGRHGAQRGCSFRAQPVKGVDNSHHRAEEAHERAGRCNGRQPGQPPFERGYRLTGRRLRRPLEGRQVARRSRAACLPLVGLVNLLEDLHQWACLALLGDCCDFLQAGCLPEGAQEPSALPGRFAEA